MADACSCERATFGRNATGPAERVAGEHEIEGALGGKQIALRSAALGEALENHGYVTRGGIEYLVGHERYSCAGRCLGSFLTGERGAREHGTRRREPEARGAHALAHHGEAADVKLSPGHAAGTRAGSC